MCCFTIRNCLKMNNWQEEKKKYLSMGLERKRMLYKTNVFIPVNSIPTWKEYAAKHQPLPEKMKILPSYKLDVTKNKPLVDLVSVVEGDITSLEVDAIVNSAHPNLLGGRGVDAAIHKGAGPLLLEECKALGNCCIGDAKITGAYLLPAKYVIHAVGPKKEVPNLLASCYRHSLSILRENKLKTIAFPCISTGVNKYPLIPAAHVAVYEVRKFLENHPNSIERVIFCLYGEEVEKVYAQLLQAYFPLK